MLDKLYNLFKTNAYTEISTISQIMNAILQTFDVNKFSNGDLGRNEAIDTLISQLQAHKCSIIDQTQQTQAQ